MPKMEKTLQGSLEEIDKKLSQFICCNCSPTNKRATVDTTAGGAKIRFTVYEKHAKKIWVKKGDDELDGEWKDQPHYTLSVLLIEEGDAVKLVAITGGSGQEMYFCPDCGPEGELMDVLNTAVLVLDQIIVA